MQHIRIGSRGSDLALWQAHHVKKQLESLGHTVEIIIIKTKGDAIQHLSFDKIEGKGFFTKEIEQALLEHTIDLAVHSHKDLETNPPAGLLVACVSERENPADILLMNKQAVDTNAIWNLKSNAIVGTSAARRKAQIVRMRADLEIKDIRGNVGTRIQKLRDGDFDAILLAKAGVERLGLDLNDFYVHTFSPFDFVPAPAQGVLALQIRSEDQSLYEILQAINHPEVQNQIGLERKVLNLLDGGCQLPLGVYCTNDKVYVAFAQNWEDGALLHEYDAEEHEGLAELIVADLKAGLE